MVGVLFLWVGHFSSNIDEQMTIVRNMFPGHLISRFGDVPWQPRSTSLSTCDFLRLTLRRLMSYIYIYIYIYMEHPFLMFLDHTQRRSTVGRTPLDE